ncbi:hypothetical protein, partial [Nocardia farcinica]|uniref:hypothetical protein n=1 Tax=Nocardia farcinica TaxID=37329 RepID=UPI001E5FF298
VSTGVPSRQRANAGLDQNPVTSSIIFREGAPSRDPQVLIIAPAHSPLLHAIRSKSALSQVIASPLV